MKSKVVLLIFSLAYYGFSDPTGMPVIVALGFLNYAAGFYAARGGMVIFFSALLLNLIALLWFKYGELTGLGVALKMPMGFSFFAFMQIAYLVHCWRGREADRSKLDYALFTFLPPHLAAGPISREDEVSRQLKSSFLSTGETTDSPNAQALLLSAGVSLFFFGLFKKLVIADTLAEIADPVFISNATLGTVDSWIGSLAYTFQIYFDFSGYSDMALGFALMLGLRLPVNFFSPYKATSIIEFWRRWHMSLSRFLRDNVYFPLGGSRKGKVRQYLNLFIVMLICGAWHGSTINFVLWGILHGVFLCLNHLFRIVCKLPCNNFISITGAGITFLLASLAWVLFRAPDIDSAAQVYKGMAGVGGEALVNHWIGSKLYIFEIAGDGNEIMAIAAMLIASAAIVFFAPNTMQVLSNARPGLETYGFEYDKPSRIRWEPSARWLAITSLIAFAALGMTGSLREFVYVQF